MLLANSFSDPKSKAHLGKFGRAKKTLLFGGQVSQTFGLPPLSRLKAAAEKEEQKNCRPHLFSPGDNEAWHIAVHGRSFRWKRANGQKCVAILVWLNLIFAGRNRRMGAKLMKSLRDFLNKNCCPAMNNIRSCIYTHVPLRSPFPLQLFLKMHTSWKIVLLTIDRSLCMQGKDTTRHGIGNETYKVRHWFREFSSPDPRESLSP